MNITRHNYEECFILCLDNELDAENREKVEQFLKENPDLVPEWEILRQSRFSPDAEIYFPGKESLIKKSADVPVSIDNYEGWFILYADGELNDEQQTRVEEFAASNPALKKDLDLFLKTRLQTDPEILCPDKNSLYRHHKYSGAAYLSIRKWAVAASFLFAFFLIALFLVTSRQENNENTLADAQPDKLHRSEIIKEKDEPVQNNQSNSINDAPLAAGSNPEPVQNHEKSQDEKDDRQSGNENLANASVARSALVTGISSGDEKLNTPLPGKESVTEINHEKPIPVPSAADLTRQSLTVPEEILSETDVTISPAQPSVLLRAGNMVDSGEFPESENGRGGKFRGIFRKITRTIERTTNLDATDGDDRFLLAGFSIRL